MRCKFEEIEVGDEVYLVRSTKLPAHDLYWTVIKKLENGRLLIKLTEMGHDDEMIIEVADIYRHNSMP